MVFVVLVVFVVDAGFVDEELRVEEDVGTDEVRLLVAVELVRVADVAEEEPPPEQVEGTVKSST